MNCRMEYTLIQQTPIIHFQHDQKGATLRATEVKPKLDKFIVNKLGGKDNVPKNWFVSDTKALNYKLRIVTTGEPRRSKMIEAEIECYRTKQQNADKKTNKQLKNKRNEEINSMYFGNMVSGKGNEYEENVRNLYKETVFYEGKEQIKLDVVCFIEELRKEIEKYIGEFFFVNNFGTRQSKGFGGFVAIKKGEEHKATDPIKTLSEQGYRFFYAEVKGDTSYTAMLNHAKNVYAVMKGGYNHSKFDYNSQYIKGFIQRKFIDDRFSKDVGSDKAFIKTNMRTLEAETHREGYGSFIFVRALLGLADYYEFRDNVRKGRVDIYSLGDKTFDVERFRSPITIKIIGNKLIFLFGSFDKICNKVFYFSPNGISKNAEFDKKTYNEKKTYIENNCSDINPSIFKKIVTPEKFDDEDIMFFINNFSKYFIENSNSLASYKDKTISCSSKLTIVIPPYLRREI